MRFFLSHVRHVLSRLVADRIGKSALYEALIREISQLAFVNPSNLHKVFYQTHFQCIFSMSRPIFWQGSLLLRKCDGFLLFFAIPSLFLLKQLCESLP